MCESCSTSSLYICICTYVYTQIVTPAGVDALKRALRIDDAQARYYLIEAEGNVKRALELYNEDRVSLKESVFANYMPL